MVLWTRDPTQTQKMGQTHCVRFGLTTVDRCGGAEGSLQPEAVIELTTTKRPIGGQPVEVLRGRKMSRSKKPLIRSCS